MTERIDPQDEIMAAKKDIWICSTCSGSGKMESKTCDQCKGHGAIRFKGIPDPVLAFLAALLLVFASPPVFWLMLEWINYWFPK